MPLGDRTCLGILGLAKRFTIERLEAASGHALASGICSYKGVKYFLDTHLDQVPLEEPASKRLDPHANIRGTSYYRGGDDPCSSNPLWRN